MEWTPIRFTRLVRIIWEETQPATTERGRQDEMKWGLWILKFLLKGSRQRKLHRHYQLWKRIKHPGQSQEPWRIIPRLWILIKGLPIFVLLDFRIAVDQRFLCASPLPHSEMPCWEQILHAQSSLQMTATPDEILIVTSWKILNQNNPVKQLLNS